jgi:hypothetical protein
MSAPVYADLISFTTPVDSKTQSGFVPLFDPTLGTLREIDFSASGGGFSWVLVSPMFEAGQYSYSYDTSFLFVRSSPPYGQFELPRSMPGYRDYSTAVLSYPSSMLSPPTPFSISDTIGAGLDWFYGSGLANLQMAQRVHIAEAATQSGITYSSGTATVTYVYTPQTSAVPELPSSVLLAGLGLLTVVGSRVCRRYR